MIQKFEEEKGWMKCIYGKLLKPREFMVSMVGHLSPFSLPSIITKFSSLMFWIVGILKLKKTIFLAMTHIFHVIEYSGKLLFNIE